MDPLLTPLKQSGTFCLKSGPTPCSRPFHSPSRGGSSAHEDSNVMKAAFINFCFRESKSICKIEVQSFESHLYLLAELSCSDTWQMWKLYSFGGHCFDNSVQQRKWSSRRNLVSNPHQRLKSLGFHGALSHTGIDEMNQIILHYEFFYHLFVTKP